MNSDEVGMKHGFRSKSELRIAEQLESKRIDFDYEKKVITWTFPEQKRKYTPDFVMYKKDGTEMIIECKGRWVTADRMKHKYLKQQFPDLDIRFVFDNPNQKLSKRSKTTYAEYCAKNGFIYSTLKKQIPAEWLQELE